MARHETMREDRWRIQARIAGRIAHEVLVRNEDEARTAFELLVQTNGDAGAYDNIELQVRRAGRARFEPVVQAVGAERIYW